MRKVAELLDVIDARREGLENENLFLWLSNESIVGQERLRFAPAMLYYLMGFKDVLGALARPSPQSDMDHAINAYCVEDGDHWRWYLRDLEKIGFSLATWGRDIKTWCNEVWSKETAINRQTIFALVGEAARSKNPIRALVLIWIFEATGVVFIGHTRKASIAMGMDDSLLYFGRRHYEEEFDHSVSARDYAQVELDEAEFQEFRELVDVMFSYYEQLFQCWFDHREKYEPQPLAHPAALMVETSK